MTNSPRDIVVNLLARAIQTGNRKDNGRHRPKNDFLAGTCHGYHRSAAVAASMAYGTDYSATKDLFRKLVRDVRADWSQEDLQDDAKVGQAATAMVEQALLVLPVQS